MIDAPSNRDYSISYEAYSTWNTDDVVRIKIWLSDVKIFKYYVEEIININ